jgi:GNAT superfamily N-acetyltransferase
MASVPWPDEIKRQFLDQQFALQHRHYLRHFSDAEFMAIEHRTRGAIGRFYLRRTAPAHLIIDICLFTHEQRKGVGEALIRHSQEDAGSLRRGVHLHVLHGNTRARQLYERLGFLATAEQDAPHQLMRWNP